MGIRACVLGSPFYEGFLPPGAGLSRLSRAVSFSRLSRAAGLSRLSRAAGLSRLSRAASLSRLSRAASLSRLSRAAGLSRPAVFQASGPTNGRHVEAANFCRVFLLRNGFGFGLGFACPG